VDLPREGAPAGESKSYLKNVASGRQPGEGEAGLSANVQWTFAPPNGPPGMAALDFPAEPDGAAGKERSAQQFLR